MYTSVLRESIPQPVAPAAAGRFAQALLSFAAILLIGAMIVVFFAGVIDGLARGATHGAMTVAPAGPGAQ